MKFEARVLRDEGIAKVDANAHEKWKAAAWDVLLGFVRSGRPFMGEDVHRECEERSIGEPHSPKAWGALIMKASRAGIICRHGWAQTKRRSNHAHTYSIWVGSGGTVQ